MSALRPAQDLLNPPADIPAWAGHGCPVDVLEGRWWVVHTKARNEKALALDLDRQKINYFLPLVKVRRRYGGRTVQLQLPLFPSYLFMCGGDDQRYSTLMTHRAAHVIPVVDQERIKQDLRQVYMVVESEEPVDLYPSLRRGRRCRVIGGGLKGLEGVVSRRDLSRVYVGVDALGQSAELEIDPGLVEIID